MCNELVKKKWYSSMVLLLVIFAFLMTQLLKNELYKLYISFNVQVVLAFQHIRWSYFLWMSPWSLAWLLVEKLEVLQNHREREREMLHTLTESKSISVLQGCGSALLENPDPDPTFGKIKIRNPSLRKKADPERTGCLIYDNLLENSSFLANKKCVHNFITLILCLHQVFPDSDLHFPGSGSDQIENIRIQLYPDPRHCCIPTLYSMNQSLQRSALIILITNDVRYWN